MANEYRIAKVVNQAINRNAIRQNIGDGLGGIEREYVGAEGEVILGQSIKGDNATSYLGTPVFSDFQIRTDEADEGFYTETALFVVNQTKNIITTPVQGRDGTIKEYISDGDYAITITGQIVNHGSKNYPEFQVQTFVSLMKEKQSLEILCNFLQLLGIYDIVITDYNLAQRAGFQNVQPFEINALSDTPINFLQDATAV